MDNVGNSNAVMLFMEMKERFPNIPEEKISQMIEKVSGNRDSCYKLLYHENNMNQPPPQTSLMNPAYSQSSTPNFSRVESRYFPSNAGESTHVFSPSPWSNSPVGRQSSYPSYYNGSQTFHQGSSPNSFQNTSQNSVPQSAPVYQTNRDMFTMECSSQMRQSPFNIESSYQLHPSPKHRPSPHQQHYATINPGGVESYVNRESVKEPNSPTRHISTLNINPAPPHSVNELSYFTRTVGSGNNSQSPSRAPQATHPSTSVNFTLSPSANSEAHRSIQFSAMPGRYTSSPNGLDENNPSLHISISSATPVPGRAGGGESSNPYQLFPNYQQHVKYPIPPRPTNHIRNYPPLAGSNKLPGGPHFNTQSGHPLQPASSRDQRMTPNVFQPQLPIRPISKPSGQTSTEKDSEYNRALIAHQKARLELLKSELKQSRWELSSLKLEVNAKEQHFFKKKNQLNSFVNLDETNKLREEITKLRVECHCLSMEVDLHMNAQVPLGVTDVDFYQNIFTGQPGPLSSNDSNKIEDLGRQEVSPGGGPAEPKRSSLSQILLDIGIDPRENPSSSHSSMPPPQPSNERLEDEDEETLMKWNCPKCTYLNHPDINVCEMCETERPPFAVDSM